uniref:Putative secreted peptide n=1 Tax=Anopheles braziliensis TaxID=58242 RepID=A0A2M3ZS07_9DIPT
MGWRKGKAFLMSLPLGIPPRRTCPCCSNIHFAYCRCCDDCPVVCCNRTSLGFTFGTLRKTIGGGNSVTLWK